MGTDIFSSLIVIFLPFFGEVGCYFYIKGLIRKSFDINEGDFSGEPNTKEDLGGKGKGGLLR